MMLLCTYRRIAMKIICLLAIILCLTACSTQNEETQTCQALIHGYLKEKNLSNYIFMTHKNIAMGKDQYYYAITQHNTLLPNSPAIFDCTHNKKMYVLWQGDTELIRLPK